MQIALLCSPLLGSRRPTTFQAWNFPSLTQGNSQEQPCYLPDCWAAKLQGLGGKNAEGSST